MSVPRAPSGVNVEELGRALATSNDWRAIVLVLVVIILALIAERGIAAWGIRKERELMAKERETRDASVQAERDRIYTIADKFTDAADKMGDNISLVGQELAILRAVSARVEANVVKG